MATGVVHERVALTLAVAGGAGLLVAYSLYPEYGVLWAGAALGLLNGLLVTPDIDQQGQTREESRWRSIPILGWIVWLAFSVFWYGYSLLFRHRGISHVPVVGTATRFVYQFGLILPFVYLSGHWAAWQSIRTALVFAWFAAWAVQDVGHILFDVGGGDDE